MLTWQRLHEVLEYQSETGRFMWLVSRGTRKAGALAGNYHDDGYCYIKIDKVIYRSTRLIWLYLYRRWPQHHIDHINRNTSDDRRANLREATRSQNLHNAKLNIRNTSGFKCVSKRGSRFRAYYHKDGVKVRLGQYDTAEEAHKESMAKTVELYGKFARVS